MTPTSLSLKRPGGLLAIGLAALVAQAFYVAGHFYGQYPQPATNSLWLPSAELVFHALYLAYGVPFVALVSLGLWWTGAAGSLSALFRRLGRAPRVPALLVLATVGGSLAVRFFILDRQVITDDEEVYLFIARTLLSGHVVNPLPQDASFFANQFVVFNTHGWFGMYPIGHPLVLALGLATGTLDAIVCLLGGATAALTWEVGRRTIGPRRALGALALLVLSPHFVWTHGTLLSQTTCSFGLMASTAAWLGWRRLGQQRWLAVSGLAAALTIMARPMPGVLFVGGLGVATLWAWRGRRVTFRAVALFAATAGAGLLIVGLVNLAESGSVFRSGYHEVNDTLGLGGQVNEPTGTVGLSLFGGLWRENFWLFGWPLSLPWLLAARVRRGAWLLWSPVLAEVVYRVAFPKTVVSTTGPIYLMEMVPVLCLLVADGLTRAGVLARRAWGKPGAVASVVLASFVAAFVFYLPVEVRAVRKGAETRRQVWTALEQSGVKRALIFTGPIVDMRAGVTWAFFPPNPSPSLDDEWLFVRWPREASDPQAAAWEFAQRRFPDRKALVYTAGDPPELLLLGPPAAKAPAP